MQSKDKGFMSGCIQHIIKDSYLDVFLRQLANVSGFIGLLHVKAILKEVSKK